MASLLVRNLPTLARKGLVFKRFSPQASGWPPGLGSGIEAVVYKKETPDWYSNRRIGIAYSGYKILAEEQSGKS